MKLILFSIKRQWTDNLLQKPFDDNPLANKHFCIIIYKFKPKEVSVHMPSFFLRAPYYSLTINMKPKKNLHILQCDGDLTMWHVEGVSLRLPLLH